MNKVPFFTRHARHARPAISRARDRDGIGVPVVAGTGQGPGLSGAGPGRRASGPCLLAFEPIVAGCHHELYALEVQARLARGRGADAVWDCSHDWLARAISIAMRRGADTRLAVNLPASGAGSPARTIAAVLNVARDTGLAARRILFEVPPEEWAAPRPTALAVLADYRGAGFRVAADHFGQGYAGLGALVDFQPDIIKIDPLLVRGIDESRSRQVAMKGILAISRDLAIDVAAMGVETATEAAWLADHKVRLMQGHYVRAALSVVAVGRIGR